ncbi:LysR substrate-binding domain-containing protein [Caballeronia sp. DA-9]|uniref:LysR family transcriptional regulator n=1 Tax=Caballeronia sp. DA-9 TaxID=3436237 RepID=UPI003F66CAA8
MNDRFLSMYVFACVARAGSFSGAARELGMSQPSVSRIVSELERRVGAALLTRTTRAVTLTEAGWGYLERAEAILVAVDEADHAARGSGELRGLLRVAMSTSFAIRAILPALSRFTDAHPALRVEFVLADHRQDLVSGSVDLAVRIGPLADSTNAVARKLAVTPRVLAASRAYLAKTGTPDTPDDLSRHALILGPAGRGPDAWTFSKDGGTTSVRMKARFVLNSNEAAVAAALAGLGIVSSGLLGCAEELKNGTLLRVLSGWDIGSGDIHVILPAGRAAKPSARAFADFVASEFVDSTPNGRLSTGPTMSGD